MIGLHECKTPRCGVFVRDPIGSEEYCSTCIAHMERAAQPVLVLTSYHPKRGNSYWHCTCFGPGGVLSLSPISASRVYGEPTMVRSCRGSHCVMAHCLPWEEMHAFTIKLASECHDAQARGLIKSFRFKLHR